MIDILIECCFIFVATIGFSIIFNVKSNQLIYCGFTGVVCFAIYKVFLDYLGLEFYGVVLGTFVGVVIARRLAYIRKIPAAIYAIPAIIPLAPGGTIYLTIYNTIYGNYVDVLKYAFITTKIAGGIVIGMSIALSLPNKWFGYSTLMRGKR